MMRREEWLQHKMCTRAIAERLCLGCTGVVDNDEPACQQLLLGAQLPDKRTLHQLQQLPGAGRAAAAGQLWPGRLPVSCASAAAAGTKQPACLLLPGLRCVHQPTGLWRSAAAPAAAGRWLPGARERAERAVVLQPVRAAAAAAAPAAGGAVRAAVRGPHCQHQRSCRHRQACCACPSPLSFFRLCCCAVLLPRFC